MLPDLPHLPVFDEERALQLLDGDRELLEDVLDLFQTTSRRLLEEIEEARTAGDREALRKSAHSLKGAAANICATRVQEVARTLEECCSGASDDDLDALVSLLGEQVAEVCAAIAS